MCCPGPMHMAHAKEEIFVKKLSMVVCWVVAALIVASCVPAPPTLAPQTAVPAPAHSPLPAPGVAESPLASAPVVAAAPQATPEPGKAAVQGKLVSDRGDIPIAGTQFYLKPAGDEGEAGEPWSLILVGPETAKGDIDSQSGPQGEFFINNVPPGTYYLIVWAPYNWIPVTNDGPDEFPRRIELKAGEIGDLGELVISWP